MSRISALTTLVQITAPISEAIASLSQHSWDSCKELVLLKPEHICKVLSLFQKNELSAAEVEIWANALECRDDVGFSTPLVSESLHELANPLLTEPLSNERAEFWCSTLCHAL